MAFGIEIVLTSWVEEKFVERQLFFNAFTLYAPALATLNTAAVLVEGVIVSIPLP